MAVEKRRSKPDRTKYGPTPRPGAPRPAAPSKRASGPLLPLLGVALGALLLVGGVTSTRDLADQHHRPQLRMTVESCTTLRHGKSSETTCQGTGDPGGTDVVGSRWRLRSAPERYPTGTVVAVRCARDAVCDVLTLGNHVLALAVTAGGLLMAGAGLTAAATQAADRFAPHRAALLRTRRVRRRLAWTGVGTALLAVAASLLFMFV
ncbi:hypothetical protein [Kitasatospora sp. NPDC004531]